MDFTKIFSPASISARWTENASNRIPYIGEGFFPVQKKAGLDLSFIKGSKGLPISLMPSAFDVKSTFRDRIGVSKLETEMPYFKEGFKIKEIDRQNLLRAADSKDPYVMSVLNGIYNDADELVEGAIVASERERMQLLFPVEGNMGITIVANGVTYTYNYDPDGSWKAGNYFALTGNAKWSDTANSNPFADIDTAKQAIAAKTGANLSIALMNTATFNYLMNNAKVNARFLSRAAVTVGYLTRRDVLGVVEDTAEIRVVIYDKPFRDENKVAHKFIPDGYVALLPEGALGNTWYGTTPEEADLMGSNAAEVALVNQGIAVKKIVDTDPVNVNTIVSQIVLPSFERMDDVAVLKVV